jgi:hypothetical protein
MNTMDDDPAASLYRCRAALSTPGRSRVDGTAAEWLCARRETVAERMRSMPETAPLMAFWQPG